MPLADDKGIGIKGWISGSKPKPRTEEPRAEQEVLDKHRIAILPFSNISPDTKDEYFADGMTEELISTMSKISGLVVIARTSVMGYKGGQKKISEVAKELQVGAVLEGSVRKAGDRLRITVQLIDPQTSGHIWAESYDRELKDVFAIQTDISKTIAHTLKVQLLPKERATIESKQTVIPDAYTLYLRGRFFWNQRDMEGLTRAVELFEKAIQLDPEYALAYAGLADSYYIIAQHGFGDPLINYQRAGRFVRKALELDDDLPEAHTTLGGLYDFQDYDWAKAEEEYKRAIELNPSYATAHQWYHILLRCQGRLEEAYDEIKKALVLDPLSLIMNTNLGQYFIERKEFGLAERQIKHVLEMNPKVPDAHWALTRIYLQTARPEEALQEVLTLSKLSNDASDGKLMIAIVDAQIGRTAEARDLLSELVKTRADEEYVDALGLADLSVLVGDVDSGFKWLERAYEERNGNLPFLKLDHAFDSLRSDPRYLSMLKKIGLH